MNFNFDKYNRLEMPSLILRRSDDEDVGILKLAYDLKFKLRWNDISQVTFNYPRYIGIDGETGKKIVTPYYELIKAKKKLYIPEFEAVFLLEKPTVVSDGMSEYIEVVAYSLENELNHKYINGFKGTYPLYDPLSPSTSLLGILIENLSMSQWSIGTIDSSLFSISRTFDETSSTIYKFLMTDVETSFECVFTFDTVNKKINATSIYNLENDTNINLTFDNLLKRVKIEEQSDQLITCLSVYGDNGLSIAGVNPIGTEKIYNFDNFLTEEWLPNAMIKKVTSWKNLYKSFQPIYADYLTQLKNNKAEIIALETELTGLKGDLTSLINIKQVRIEQNLSLTSINSQIASKESEIDSKKAEINNAEAEIDNINTQLSNIHSQLAFTSYFNQDEIKILDSITYEGTYKSDNFVKTSIMNNVEIQEQQQELFDYGTRVLNRVSKPRYSFNVDSVAFPFLKEYESFSDSLAMGEYIRIEMREDYEIYPLLIEMELNYSQEDNFSLTFSNRTRSDASEYYFADLANETINSATTVSFDSSKWSESTNFLNDEVSKFLKSSLNAANNSIISSSHQDIIIDEHGIRCRKKKESSSGFDPNQLWISHSSICMSDDGFDTSKLCLGEVSVDGSSHYGLVGELIVGNLIASNKLMISNSSNSFVVDSDGIKCTNATVNISSTNGKGRIIIDPNDTSIFTLESKKNDSFDKRIWMDILGDMHLTGKITASEISGSTIKGSNISGTTITGGSLNGTSISGGSLNIGNGDFRVTSNGRVTAKDISITGGSFNINDLFTVDKHGNLTASNGTFNNGIFSGDITSTATISGGEIKGADIFGSKFFNESRTGWLEIAQHESSNIADFNFMTDTISSDKPFFQLYNRVTALDIKAFSDTFLSYENIFKSTYPHGIWDFKDASIINPLNLGDIKNGYLYEGKLQLGGDRGGTEVPGKINFGYAGYITKNSPKGEPGDVIWARSEHGITLHVWKNSRWNACSLYPVNER